MKKLYTFTLSDDDEPSSDVINNFKLIIYLLYYELLYYQDEYGVSILIKNKILKYNELYECVSTVDFNSSSFDINSGSYHGLPSSKASYSYRFESERGRSDVPLELYDPVIIKNGMFGITTFEDTDDSIIWECLDKALRTSGKFYNIKVDSYMYSARNVDDESKRIKTIQRIRDGSFNTDKPKTGKIRKLVSIPAFGLIK